MIETGALTQLPMLTLYVREYCHLCEMAQALLQDAEMPFQAIDIDSELELGARYGLRIPVLRHPDGREMDWPFPQGPFPQRMFFDTDA